MIGSVALSFFLVIYITVYYGLQCNAPSGAGIFRNFPSSAFTQTLATSEHTDNNLSSSYLSNHISASGRTRTLTYRGATSVKPIGIPFSLANPGILTHGTCNAVHIEQNLASPV